MNKANYRVWLALSLIIVWGTACSVLGGGDEKPTDLPVQESEQGAPTSAIGAKEGGSGGEQVLDTEFPLPKDVQGFMHLGAGDSAVNFQTKMSLEETMEFYRKELTAKGLSEEPILSVIDDDKTGFSMVFRGGPNDKEVVVQGVDLGNDTTNVNIRYEDVD